MMNPLKILKKSHTEEEKLLEVKTSDKKKTVDVLLEESKLSQSFYFMLVFSSVIISSGIILNQLVIVLAGMLITPMLSPILSLALGIVILDIKLVVRSLRNIIISMIIVFGISAILAFIYSLQKPISIDYRLEFNWLYLVIAFFSGMAATLAWTKKNLSEILSGVAVAISLVPPLAIFGISMPLGMFSLHKVTMLVFALNFAAILAGSGVIFLLQNFYKVRKTAQKELQEELENEKKQ